MTYTIRQGRANLPEPRHGHCLAYDQKDNVIFVTGGIVSGTKHGPSSKAWKFHDPEKFILDGTTHMKKGRWDHGCGIVRSNMHNGRPLLVVAGSMKGSAPDGGGGNNCEFYDYTRQGSQWELCSKSNS